MNSYENTAFESETLNGRGHFQVPIVGGRMKLVLKKYVVDGTKLARDAVLLYYLVNTIMTIQIP